MKDSVSQFHCLPELVNLKPGLYWNLEQDANAGYYVSIDAEKISFTLCSINCNTVDDFMHCKFNYDLFDNKRMCISLETMQNFLTLFFKNYSANSTTNRIQIYKSNMGHYFHINYLTEKVHWGKKVYDIKNKKCIIKHSITETFIINLKQNDIIQLIHHNTKDKFQYKPFKKTEEIEPISLEAHILTTDILNLQKKIVDSQRKIFEMDFRITKDHISLYRDGHAITYTRVCSIYSFTSGKFPSNGVQRSKHTFEELSNLFVPLKLCKCTNKKNINKFKY